MVIKDGEVMPGWTDEDTPSVAHDRAVIPGDVDSATFYLMMADEDLAVPNKLRNPQSHIPARATLRNPESHIPKP